MCFNQSQWIIIYCTIWDHRTTITVVFFFRFRGVRRFRDQFLYAGHVPFAVSAAWNWYFRSDGGGCFYLGAWYQEFFPLPIARIAVRSSCLWKLSCLPVPAIWTAFWISASAGWSREWWLIAICMPDIFRCLLRNSTLWFVRWYWIYMGIYWHRWTDSSFAAKRWFWVWTFWRFLFRSYHPNRRFYWPWSWRAIWTDLRSGSWYRRWYLFRAGGGAFFACTKGMFARAGAVSGRGYFAWCRSRNPARVPSDIAFFRLQWNCGCGIYRRALSSRNRLAYFRPASAFRVLARAALLARIWVYWLKNLFQCPKRH